jgi:hypothetical protein
MLALKVGHLMSVLRKIRSYRIGFDNQQNGMPLLFVKVRDPLPDSECARLHRKNPDIERAIISLSYFHNPSLTVRASAKVWTCVRFTTGNWRPPE